VLPRQTYDRFLERFGVPIRSLYGSTEAGSIAINTDPDGQMEAGSLGPPLRNVAITIRDAEGKELPAGVDGEIWVKSPTIPPSGYDNRSDLTYETFRAGFYKTGDIGRRNHRGHLILAGRKQSFINIAGNKVDTSEVEEVLASCPGVREAAVLGVEVPRMGTLVKAAVVTDGPCQPAEIREFCRQRLAFYKVPRLIEAYPSLPRSAMGKVLKSALSGVESYLQEIRNAEATRIVGRLATVSAGKRRGLVTSLVQAQVAAVLGRPLATVPRNLGFIELGMDSFGAIELQARLEYLFDQELPQTFTFDQPTVDAVTDSLMGLVEKR
jgi:long-chain acyl-CoA synthetase